jgi:hypothetical protein
VTSSIADLSLTSLQPKTMVASLKAQTDSVGLSYPDTALLVSFTSVLSLPCS